MKKLLLFVFAFVAQVSLFAQGNDHVTFSTSSRIIDDKTAEIIVTAKLAEHWHLYALDPGGDGSLIAPEIKVKETSDIKLIGKVREKGKIVTQDVKGVGTIRYYKNTAQFIQKVSYKKKGKTSVNIYYQVCDDEKCDRPDEVDIEVDLSKAIGGTKGNKIDPKVAAQQEKKRQDSIAQAKKVQDEIYARQKDSIEKAMAAKNQMNQNPDSNAADDTTQSAAVASTGHTTNGSEVITDANKKTYGEFGQIVSDCGEVQDAGLTMWTAFLFGILGGLAALFFPCTLPMIPMTISFFLKGAGDRKQGVKNGIWYGFSIFLVYFLLSLPFLFLGWGGNTLNEFSTNFWVNLVFAIIFIIFSFSLFGFYDISLPSSLTNKIDSKSNATSFGGIFFMALTLAIVSFSCTGPILGLVLGNITNAKLITPAMSGFGIGLGVPFALFAMFPNLLKALPKSGGWLTVLKAVFGFIELAFALKFLSNADLVRNLGLLKRETFLAIWIVLCIITALYLLGKFSFKKIEKVNSTRNMKLFAVMFFALAGYISLDFFGVNVNLFGFPPPKFYAYGYDQPHEDGVHYVNGIKTYTDLERALEEGKKANKPVMIDFTGWACVNCRKMEENVWVKPEIKKYMTEDYIIASLYVDEQIELPANERFMSPYLKGMAKTYGDKWFDLALRNFKAASQPYYALIDPINHRILNTPKAYTPDAKEYENFLKCGLSNFKSLHP